ncbi:MAG: hypothetical protein JWO13_414 [Acidobacteriales bacterium]|nr:hypothetical protein [Terriglobales bacterium]
MTAPQSLLAFLRMENRGSKLEAAANVAIVIVAVLVIAVIVRNQLSSQQPNVPPQIAVGASVPLKDTDWKGNSKTLVLGISTTCHYCTESAPFYQRIARQTDRSRSVHMMAVLPQPFSEAMAYLAKLKVPVRDVRQATLASIPISGTPTILLVNDRGIVQKVWRGKLPPEDESEVMKEIGCTGPEYCQ